MIKISHFVVRYYYFFEDELQSLERLIDTLNQTSLLSIENTKPQFMGQQAMFYKMNYAYARMTILGVRTAQEIENWSEGLQKLGEWEEQAGLAAEELYGQLTILVGVESPWGELMGQACALMECPEPVSLEIRDGKLARLATEWDKSENLYLCGLDEWKDNTATFLMRRLPYLHANIIRLHMLGDLLSDRNTSIRQEKDEMEKNLISILHTKLVMTQASQTADELESEIEKLAGSYGMLVGDQKLILDGIKRLESQLVIIERQILSESALNTSSTFFKQLTDPYQQILGDLQKTYDELTQIREDYQAAIEVVQSKIDIMNSRTNIATQEQIKGLLEVNTSMQKQSLVFQYAAGLIEFIVLAYYSHTLWSHLSHAAYLAIPGWIQFIVVFLFSGNTVMVTHLLAEYMQGEHHVRRKLITTAIPLILIIILVIVASMFFGSHGAPAE